MPSDTTTTDAFAAGQREAREADRVALVAALGLPAAATWEESAREAARIRKHRAELHADILSVESAVSELVRQGRMLPIEDLRCPWCGCSVKWSCGVGEYPTGHADCEDGTRVSRRLGRGKVCEWAGASLVRLGERVVAPLPVRGDHSSATHLADPASRYSTASDAGIARESEPGAPVTTIYDVEGDL